MIVRLFLSVVAACVLASGCGREPDRDSSGQSQPPAAAAVQATVTGRVSAARRGTPALVFLRPAVPRDLPPQRTVPILDQIERQFIPDILFARAGQPTAFLNSDDQLHNVRVRDEATLEGAFNVAIPVGERYLHTFGQEGFYDVWCDIHPEMRATLVVTSTPYTAIAANDGAFTIYGVPAGAYIATVQSGTEIVTRELHVEGARTELTVE